MPAYEYVRPPLFLPLLCSPEQTDLRLASRLADFATNEAEPRPSHREWLRGPVADLLRARPGAWVQLVGYASALGDPAHNMDLSNRRMQRVEATIRAAMRSFDAFFGWQRGEEESGRRPNDNSPGFRAVDVVVYGPEAPKPAPPAVLTEKRLVHRETLERKVNTQSLLPHDGPPEFEIPGNPLGDLLSATERVRRHPCEEGDPDFGDVVTTRSLDVVGTFILIGAAINRIYKRYPPEFQGPERRTRIDIVRRYQFTYGPGTSGQKTLVVRNEMMIDPKGAVTSLPQQRFYADQPPSYVDP
jgi:hypothetical protein